MKKSNEQGQQRALIVEGGAMRGIFATGVLDEFINHAYYAFDVAYGVSAGATTLAAYLAGQRGRNHSVITDYSCRNEFIQFGRFIKGGHLLDLDWLWDITVTEIPLDLEKISAKNIPLYCAVTEVATGKAYYPQLNAANALNLLKATCSVPLGYRDFVTLVGKAFTDGGVADSIPVQKAYQDGARHITVVLSKPLGYRKKASKTPWLTKALFKDTPAICDVMLKRHLGYNAAIDFITSPPDDCQIEVIAPPVDFNVGRLTRDKARLDKGYQQGINAAKAYLADAAAPLV